MNKQRREIIRRAINLLESAHSLLQDALYEERDAMENIPENLQSSDRYEEMEQSVDFLEDAVSSVDEAKRLSENALG